MGFGITGTKTRPDKGILSPALLHEHRCKVCPLNRAKLKHPKMLPTGSDKPYILMLGEAPGEEEDDEGKQFVGRAGRLLRRHIPADWQNYLMWDNVVRCRPTIGIKQENRPPERIEIEACRSHHWDTLDEAQPRAIFGFGAIPLNWALGQVGISKWRGRRCVAYIDGRSYWYYPMWHPSYILRRLDSYGGEEDERMFILDLAKAFGEVERLPLPLAHTRDDAERNVELVFGGPGDVQKVVRFLQYAAQQRVNGLDFETTGDPNGLRPYNRGAAIISIAVSTIDRTLAFAFDHPEAKWSSSDLEIVRQAFVEYLLDERPIKAVHQLGFELEWIAVVFGVDFVYGANWHDTISQASILDSRVGDSKPGCFALEFLSLQYFGLNVKSLSNLNRANLVEEPIEDELLYNGIDAKYHALLYVAQEERLKEENLVDVYERQRWRIPACVLTQVKGIITNPQENERLSTKYSDLIDKSLDEIANLDIVVEYERKYGKFEPTSPKQVVDLLNLLGTSVHKSEENGKTKYSVDEEALGKLDHPIAQLIIDLRHYSKQKSTYVDPYSLKRLFPDGIVHQILNTVYAETGRSSSEDPNTQNIPKHDEEGKEVRKQIVAPKGFLLVSADYGQIQARNIAMESKDPTLIQSFIERRDIHKDWAEYFKAEYPAVIDSKHFHGSDDPMKNLRQKTKNRFVFAAFFGAHEGTIASGMEIPKEVARRALDAFWREFPGVKDWHEKLKADYRKKGYVEAICGRRRPGPLTENKIINSPIQADESEIVFHAFTTLSQRRIWELQPVLEIHDDLQFYIPENNVDHYCNRIVSDMLSIPFSWINVPLLVEIGIGRSLYNIEEVGKYWSDTWFK